MKKDLTEIFADIDTYLYKYTNEAQEMRTENGSSYNDEGRTDDKEHIGIMAQELLKNPITKDCVITDENGKLAVDTSRLTLTLAGVLAQVCKKVEELEARLV